MKNFITIIFLICMVLTSYSQSGFDKALGEISDDLTDKLNKKDKRKIVVLFIKDINKATTVAGKYLADIVSVNIVNDIANFQVFDRENLIGIVEANKLISEGYIDVDKAKELGKLLSVEAIVIGNYTVLSNTIKLTLKALDSNTGFVIAASIKDLPIDGDAGALLGINVPSPNGTPNGDYSPRGFIRPITSNEQYNNPETVNEECETKNLGDYCFENKYMIKLRVCISLGNGCVADMILSPNQTQCSYNLKATDYKYLVYKGRNVNGRESFNDPFSIATQGEILVERCKSKTFVLK